MKAKLQFDLNDYDQKKEHLRCVKSTDMAITLFEIINNIKRNVEDDIDDEKFTDQYEVLNKVFEMINSKLDDNNINLDELID